MSALYFDWHVEDYFSSHSYFMFAMLKSINPYLCTLCLSKRRALFLTFVLCLPRRRALFPTFVLYVCQSEEHCSLPLHFIFVKAKSIVPYLCILFAKGASIVP